MHKLQQIMEKYAIRVTLTLNKVPNKLLLYSCIVSSCYSSQCKSTCGIQFTTSTEVCKIYSSNFVYMCTVECVHYRWGCVPICSTCTGSVRTMCLTYCFHDATMYVTLMNWQHSHMTSDLQHVLAYWNG